MNSSRAGPGARGPVATFLFAVLSIARAGPPAVKPANSLLMLDGVPLGIVTGPVTIGGNVPVGGFSLADVVMVNGQRVVYFNAADAQGNIQIGGAPPPQVASAPVPINAPLALLLAALAVMGAAFEGMRMRRRKSGTGA